jgi:hypothetical protein
MSEEHYVIVPCFMKVTSIEKSVNIDCGNISKWSLRMLFGLHTLFPSVRLIHHVYRLLPQKCGKKVLQNLQLTQKYFR